jgi:RsiW-degrading membrane proteinase PrsW (M82 family)
VATAASGAPASTVGWTAMEVGSLVTTGVLVIILWLWFRKLKFPE